jgi:hypothetical protein
MSGEGKETIVEKNEAYFFTLVIRSDDAVLYPIYY